MALVESTTGEIVGRSLEQCEAVIERGLETFTQVGEALVEIRDGRLYRAEFPDFDAYCRDRWGMSKRHANRTIEAAEIAGVLGPIGPTSESHARALSPLKDEPERMREAFQKATAEAEAAGSKLTADRIKAAVNELTGDELAEGTTAFAPSGRTAQQASTPSATSFDSAESGDREASAGSLIPGSNSAESAIVDPLTGEAPALQVMPELDAEIDAALRDSIKTYGVLIPIIVTQDGQIIDGHNRWRIAADLNVSCPQTVRDVKDEAEAMDVARTLNLDRRHLDKAARVTLARSLREKGHPMQAIAGALGVGTSTIARDLDEPDELEVSHTGKPPTGPRTVTGQNGVEQPAKKRRWTSDDLAELLAKRQAGTSVGALAEEYGVSVDSIYDRIAAAKHAAAKGSTRVDALAERESKLREMAAQGYTTRQICKAIGIGREATTRMAQRLGVEIPADAVVGKTRLHDSTRIVTETVISLDGTVMALGLVDLDDLDPAQCAEWATSISESLRALTRFRNQLKEMAL